ncbi:adenylate kinase family protein, partial [Streptobacillus moniliformis]
RRVSKKTGKIYHIIYNPPVDENPEDLEQRADDTAEVVKKRLENYKNQTAPVLEYYKNQGKVSEIQGERESKYITEEIIDILSNNCNI